MKKKNKTEIFSTEKGMLAIESPVKKKILHLLSHEEKTGKEIREKLGKAKSTISVHLSDLENAGLIEEKINPTDERKKIYSISANLLGKSQLPSDKAYKSILSKLKNSAGDSYEFLKNLFHLIRYGFDSLGINVSPALREIGKDAGKNLSENFKSETLPELFEEIKDFWDDNRLGNIEIDEKQLIVQDCFDCGGLPEIGTTVCSLDEGIIEGIIEEKTKHEVRVREKECYGTGKNHCKFKIEIEDSFKTI